MEFFIKYPFNPLSLFLYATIIILAITIWYAKKGKPGSLEKFVLSAKFQGPVFLFLCLAVAFDALMSYSEGNSLKAFLGILSTLVTSGIIFYYVKTQKKP